MSPNICDLEYIADNLVKWIKEVDKTRPTTAGLAGLNQSNFTSYPGALDVAGYNYYERLYEEDHEKFPERIIYGSENGKGLSRWEAVINNDYISGIFLWTGVDFLGEAGRWPSNHSNAGMLDLAGDPKSSYYFQKSLWVEEPMIYIGTSRFVPRTGDRRFRRSGAAQHYNYNTGDTVRVSCYTNCEEVELFRNGISFGKIKLSDTPTRIMNWEIPFEAGKLEAKAYNKGVEVVKKQLQTVGEPAGFKAVFDKESYLFTRVFIL